MWFKLPTCRHPTAVDLNFSSRSAFIVTSTVAPVSAAEVRQRITGLTALKAELEPMIAGCADGKVAQCGVIEIVADHGKCEHRL